MSSEQSNTRNFSAFELNMNDISYRLKTLRTEMERKGIKTYQLQGISLFRETLPKTAPVNDVSYKMVMHLPETYLKYLVHLYIRIFRKSTVPESWKKNHPHPRHGYCNRPISLTRCLYRLLEKMVNLKLTWFLKKYNVLTEFQYDFGETRSSVTPMWDWNLPLSIAS